MKKSEVFKGLDGRNAAECFAALRTPCYVIDEERLKENGRILASVAEHTGCRILLAQKAFSNYAFYPLLAPYLAGTEASGLYEARLGAEEMPGKEVHVFCAAYREDEFAELLKYADHIVFNSVRQLKTFGPAAKTAGRSVGLRINPECSTQEGHALYDPCAPGSRLGVTREAWNREMTGELHDLLDGLHFHTLCEQDADALETTLEAVEAGFGDVLPRMKWLNMGGGHHITRADYDRPRLERVAPAGLNEGHLFDQQRDVRLDGGTVPSAGPPAGGENLPLEGATVPYGVYPGACVLLRVLGAAVSATLIRH